MRKAMFLAAGLAAIGCLGYFGTWVSAQNNPSNVQPAAGSSKPTLKIGVINLSKVLKEFNKANVMGDTLLKDAQNKEKYVKDQETILAGEQAKVAAEPDKAKAEAMSREIRQKQNQLQELLIEYKKKFTDEQTKMAVEVHGNIQQVIDSIAKTYGLELVLTYPDIASADEAGKPAQAYRMLSAPATMIAYKHPGLDVTDTVIATLNTYFKPPAGTTPVAPGGAQP